MATKFLLHNFTLKPMQTSPRLQVLTLSPCLFPASLGLISRHRFLASDWGRLPYLEINTTLTAPIVMEIPLGVGVGWRGWMRTNDMPDNGGTSLPSECYQLFFFFFFPFFLFYEQLMYSHASAGAVRYYLHSLTPLRQTHVMTHAMEQEEEEEEKKRCC